MAANLHISINAEEVLNVAGISISNSMITTWLVTIIIVLLAKKTYQSFSNITPDQKPSRFQSLMEMIIESLYNLVHSIAGTRQKARIFFPIVSTIFIFVLISNWSGLLPGVGTINIKAAPHSETKVDNYTDVNQGSENTLLKDGEKAIPDKDHQDSKEESTQKTAPSVAGDSATAESINQKEDTHETEKKYYLIPLFRGPTADLNTTLALAVFAMISVQYMGFKFLGSHYTHKFVNFKGPIDFFVGILEFVSEISKIISFAFRLFGNIFAGEVLLVVIAFLLPIFGPIPFIGLEIFVGFIQALVFSLLTLVFMNLATMSHGGDSH